MLKNFTFLLAALALLSSCATQKTALTRANLKPVGKIYVLDKENMPIKPVYILSLYNDQRLELMGYAMLDKLGAFTTVLNSQEYKAMDNAMKQFDVGHVSYNHPDKQLGYDILYYALQKEVTMANAKILPISDKTKDITMLIDDFIAYKNWIKKEDAPKIYGDVIPNEVIVTMKPDAKADVLATSLNATYGTVIKSCIDPTTRTWLMSYKSEDVPALMQAIRKSDMVIGTIENAAINTQSLQTYAMQELIVKFNSAVNVSEWVKKFAGNKMQLGKTVAPDMNLHVVSFDSNTVSAKEIMAKIKQDAAVSEVQLNRKVSPRE